MEEAIQLFVKIFNTVERYLVKHCLLNIHVYLCFHLKLIQNDSQELKQAYAYQTRRGLHRPLKTEVS